MSWRWISQGPPVGWLTQSAGKGFFPVGGETAHWWTGDDFLCDEARAMRGKASWWVAKDNGPYIECVRCAAARGAVAPAEDTLAEAACLPAPTAPAPSLPVPARVKRRGLPSTGTAQGSAGPGWGSYGRRTYGCDCNNGTCADCELRLLGLGGAPEYHREAVMFLRVVYHHQGPIGLGDLLDRCGWTLPRTVKEAKGRIAAACRAKGYTPPYRDSTDPETGERTFEWVRGRATVGVVEAVVEAKTVVVEAKTVVVEAKTVVVEAEAVVEAGWGAAALHFERRQPTEQERRRAGRAAQRDVMVWVPPAGVGAAETDRIDRWGALPGLAGRSRAPLPMRTCMGLWGRGHGTAAIAQIAAAVGVDVSSSAVGRLLKQATDAEDAAWHGRPPQQAGAELAQVSRLTAEVMADNGTVEGRG